MTSIRVNRTCCKNKKKCVFRLICLPPSNTFSNRFSLEIYVSKSKVSNDLDENCLKNETFVTGGHLEFLRQAASLSNAK
jgi:hypothetical protein